MDNQPTEFKPIKMNTNLSNHALWADHLEVATRNDGMCFLRFSAHMPEGHCEQAKIFTSEAHLKIFMDAICSQLKYYPEPKGDKDE